MNIRGAAARIIYQVVSRGKSLAEILSPALKKYSDARDQTLLQTLCYGVCRRFFYLDAVLTQLLEKPLKEKDADIRALLLVGLYQITDLRIPVYAAVAETVAATTLLKKPWAKSLVNAVLRNYPRRATLIEAEINLHPAQQFAHPQWLVDLLQTHWPTTWTAILTANNTHPPLTLRVNARCLSRADYLKKLTAATIPADIITETQNGIVLAQPQDVKQLPGFLQGELSVQDGAAQLAAELLQLTPYLRVLDACAAPGGKTAHIAEQEPQLAKLVALDKDAKRLLTLTENLRRLQLTAICLAADALNTAQWWDGEAFDRILLDAPCSATGVIRRHPDIKILRRAADIATLAHTQLQLLTALWPLLKTGGKLLYATCSVLPPENNEVIAQFLAGQANAEEEKIQVPWGVECPIGRQILPGMHGMDGFYYALLRKC